MSLLSTPAGSSPLKEGPIAVAIYVVHFPEIAICVGLDPLIMGVWDLARRFRVLVPMITLIGMALVSVFSMTRRARKSPAPTTLGLQLLPAQPSSRREPLRFLRTTALYG